MLFIILALIFYTIAIMAGTVASRNADTNLVTAIINIVSVIIPTAVVIPMLSKKLLTQDKFGIVFAAIGGIAIALFTLALNKSYSLNKVAIVSPIVFGGAIFLTAVLSFIFLKEKISFVQGVGLLFLGIGIAFIIYAKASGR